MAVTLKKGGEVSLSKPGEVLTRVLIGLGWDAKDPRDVGADFDLDASAFGLCTDASGRQKAFSDQFFIFYGNLQSPANAIVHMGDNRTGDGDGDDEELVVDVTQLHPKIDTIAFPVTIHDAVARRQNFGNVENAYIRIVNAVTNEEVARYNLTDDFGFETAIIFGELYRKGSDWMFRAVGRPVRGGLEGVVTGYGIEVEG